MKIKPSFFSLLIGLICFPLLTGATAQQALGQIPTEEEADDPVIIRPTDSQIPRRSFQTPQDRDPIQDQVIVINSKYAGWESASDTPGKAERISKDLRANWIMVDSIGRFDGVVIPGEGADVKNMNVFLMHMGRLVNQTSLDSEGRFDFNNVRQGAYSLIGWGDNGFFAFGVNILEYNAGEASAVSNSVRITAFQNKTSINTDWIQHFAPLVNFRVYGRYLTGEGRDDPQSLYGLQGLNSHVPESRPATSISSHPVRKTADGRLVGRVHQMTSINGRPVDVRTTKVMLFQGDHVVASTTIDNYGVFEFNEVPDGSFGVVASGVDGVGMIGITVGKGSAAMNDAGEFTQQEEDSIDFTMVPSESIGWLNHYAEEVAYRRALMEPRQKLNQGPGICATCGNQQGGCAACRAEFTRCCKNKNISFEQWVQSGCQCGDIQKFGDGSILAAAAKKLRTGLSKANELSENAFYPTDARLEQIVNEANQASQGQDFQNQGFQNQGYQNQGYQNQGYQNQGYQNQGYQAYPNQP